MSADRCVSFAREFGHSDAKARELCRDRDLQRCATFWRPQTAKDLSFDNLAACYGTSASNEKGD